MLVSVHSRAVILWGLGVRRTVDRRYLVGSLRVLLGANKLLEKVGSVYGLSKYVGGLFSVVVFIISVVFPSKCHVCGSCSAEVG